MELVKKPVKILRAIFTNSKTLNSLVLHTPIRLILIVSKKRGSEFYLFGFFFGNFLGCQNLDGLPYRICNFASKLFDFRFCALPSMPKYEPRIIAMLILATTWWLWRQKNHNISQGCRVFFRDFEEALSILEERHYVA